MKQSTGGAERAQLDVDGLGGNQMGRFDGRPLVWSAASRWRVCLLQTMAHAQLLGACCSVRMPPHSSCDDAIGAVLLFEIMFIIAAFYSFGRMSKTRLLLREKSRIISPCWVNWPMRDVVIFRDGLNWKWNAAEQIKDIMFQRNDWN